MIRAHHGSVGDYRPKRPKRKTHVYWGPSAPHDGGPDIPTTRKFLTRVTNSPLTTFVEVGSTNPGRAAELTTAVIVVLARWGTTPSAITQIGQDDVRAHDSKTTRRVLKKSERYRGKNL